MFIKSLSLSLLIKILGAVVGFFSNLLITQVLGIHSAGQYFSFINMVWLVSTILLLGAEQGSVRQISVNIGVDDKDVGRTMFLYTFILVLLFIALAVFLVLFNDFLNGIVNPWNIDFYYIALSIFLGCLFKLWSEYLKGMGLFLWYSFFQSCFYSFFISLAAVLFFYFEYENYNFLNFIFYILLSGFILIYMLIYSKGILKTSTYFIDLKKIKESLKLWGASISDSIIAFSGSVFLIYYSTPSEVSIFQICTRLSFLLIMIVVATNAITVVKINKLINDGLYKECVFFASHVSSLSLFIVLPPILIIMLFSEDILSIFGEGFTKGESSLYVLLFYVLFNIITSSGSVILIALKCSALHSKISIISAILFFVFVYFIGHKDAFGMSVSLSIAGISKNILTLYFVKKNTGFFIMPKLVKINTIKELNK